MRARRDQVQAYRFVTRRIVAAMLFGEPETTERPMRRLGLSVFASSMVAVLVMAGFGIFGLVTGQSGELEENTLVIEKETRATYIYIRDSTGELRLHPVENYTSAQLALGDPAPNEREVPRSAIADLPRGQRVGIVGTPPSVPEPEALVGLPWRVCSSPPGQDSPQPLSTLVIGGDIGASSGLADQALFVETEDARYLLWNEMRLEMRGSATRTVLGLDTIRPIRVSEQLINGLIAGPDLGIIRVPGAGGRSDFVLSGQDAIVGRVFLAGGQHYVLTQEGLVPVGGLTALIRLAGDIELQEISIEAAGRARAPESHRLEPEGYPQTVPALHSATNASTTICATTEESDGGATTTIEVFAEPPPELDPSAPHSVEVTQLDDDVAAVDRVWVSGGSAALVEALPTTSGTSAELTAYLVTSEGIKYPLATEAGDAQGALGYGGIDPVGVPSALLSLVPRGPTLDVAQARLPVLSGQTSPTTSGDG